MPRGATRPRTLLTVIAGALVFCLSLAAQAPLEDPSGSVATEPGPLARDVSPAFKPRAIRKAMRKVADWQLRQAGAKFSLDWTYAALYDGLLAASRATGERRYHDAVLQFAQRTGWQLGPRFAHADDEAVGQAWTELYLEEPAPERIAALRTEADRLLARPDDPKQELWWWCDALFMAPPALARLARANGDRRYLNFLEREWARTTALLYDPQAHLCSRDASYLERREANGKRLFWSRGNGWVLAGLARVLDYLPADDPARPGFEAQFREMAAAVKAIQGPDGLWRSGLLDAAAYPQPEVSGSAFFTFALAWGVNAGLLDRAAYQPAVERAWRGLLAHVYADGRLGSIQRIGAAPDDVRPGGSYVYGVGAFLLAGEEAARLAAPR
ncbi:MAG: glycoside hydrolase family 88 protein [Terracidiphilus sp.]